LPRTLAILDRQVGDQHRSGRLGNLTQTGIMDMSATAKSKNSSIDFKNNGLPKTEYGPPNKTTILSALE